MGIFTHFGQGIRSVYAFYSTHLTLPPDQILTSNTIANRLLFPMQFMIGKTVVKKESEGFIFTLSNHSLLQTTLKVTTFVAVTHFISRLPAKILLATTALGTLARLYSLYRHPEIRPGFFGERRPLQNNASSQSLKDPAPNSNEVLTTQKTQENPQLSLEDERRDRLLSEFFRTIPVIGNLQPYQPQIESLASFLDEILNAPPDTLSKKLSKITSQQPPSGEIDWDAILDEATEEFTKNNKDDDLEEFETRENFKEIEETESADIYPFALMKALYRLNHIPKFQIVIPRVYAKLDRLNLNSCLEEIHPDTEERIKTELNSLNYFFHILLKKPTLSSLQAPDEFYEDFFDDSVENQEAQLLRADYLLQSQLPELIAIRKYLPDSIKMLQDLVSELKFNPMSSLILPLKAIQASVQRFTDAENYSEGFNFQETQDQLIDQISIFEENPLALTGKTHPLLHLNNLKLQLASDFFQDFVTQFDFDSVNLGRISDWLNQQRQLKSYCFPFSIARNSYQPIPTPLKTHYRKASEGLKKLGLECYLDEVDPTVTKMEQILIGKEPDPEGVVSFGETINNNASLFASIINIEKEEELKKFVNSQDQNELKAAFTFIQLFDSFKSIPEVKSNLDQLGEESIQEFLNNGQKCIEKLKQFKLEQYLPSPQELAIFKRSFNLIGPIMNGSHQAPGNCAIS